MTKLCECGCGWPAPLARQTRRERGYVKGRPLRYVRGHNTKSGVPFNYFPAPDAPQSPRERSLARLAAWKRERRRSDPDLRRRETAAQKKHYSVRKNRMRRTAVKYGMTVDEYVRLLGLQDHACAICRKAEADSRYGSLCVDHDHKTGQTRGLLCNTCNVAIGLLNDEPDLMMSAAKYLSTWSRV